MIVLSASRHTSYPQCQDYRTYGRKSLCHKGLGLKHPTIACLWGFCYNYRMANSTFIASKDILARMLAGENLTVQHDAKAHTASFDTRNRVLTLPQWDNMNESVYDMLIGHEVGHALYTPWTERDEAIKGIAAAVDIGGTAAAPVAMQYLNIVEDARIERLIKDKFPGIRRDFAAAYKKLSDDNFFGLKGEDLSKLPLIDKINIHFKLGALEPMTFTPAEQAFVDRIEKATTFDEVTVIASDLFSYCGEQRSDLTEEEMMEQAQSDGDGDGEGDEADGNNNGQSDGTPNKSKGVTKNGNGKNGNESSTMEEAAAGANDDNDGRKASATKGASKACQVPAASKTQTAFDENVSKQFKSKARSTETGILSVPKLENIIHSYKDVMSDIEDHLKTVKMYGTTGEAHLRVRSAELSKFIIECSPSVNHMVKQFEMRKAADAAKRTSVARSGVLDTVRMVNYKINDDIFRRNAVIQDGKNHGLVMFIDWSSSMAGNLLSTAKQLIQLVLFCKKVNIPFEVYAFSSNGIKKSLPRDQYGTVSASNMWKDSDVAGKFHKAGFSTITLINFLSSNMKNTEFKRGLDMFYMIAASCSQYDGFAPYEYGLCSTPLDEAIVCAMEIVPEFQKKHKLQIVNTIFLTDGDSSGNSLPAGSTYCSSKAYILDPKTRRLYENNRAAGNPTTPTLLRILRDRTQANVIGFFLAGYKVLPQSRFIRDHVKYETDMVAYNAAAQSWKENGYYIEPSEGYTELYVIRANEQESPDALDKLGAGASATRVANAVMKDAAARNKSRMMLGRFIDLIAK